MSETFPMPRAATRGRRAKALPPPTSVLFVAAIWASLEAFVAPVAREYSSMGLHTIGASGSAPESHEAFDESLTLHEFRRRGPAHLAIAAYELARFVRHNRVGLLHLHTPAAVAMGRMVSRLTGVPAVVVVHGSFLGAGGAAERAFRLVEGATSRLAHSTVVLNDADAAFYRRFLPAESVSVAPAGGCGVDVERLRRAVRDADPTDGVSPIIGYVGRITPDKNLDFIVRALRVVRARGHDVRLRLIGDRVSGERGWQIPHEPWIETTGWLPDPYDAIAACELIASGSQREGFGMGVAEGLVMGKRVVALSNAGAEQQRKLAGERLSLVRADEGAFATAIVAALENRSSHCIQEDLAAAWAREVVVQFYREHLLSLFPELQLGRL
jgi:glycosyltransferase involved in cell wall biosynthesis